MEELLQRAETIKIVLNSKLERGIDLLLDFVRLYGVEEDVEDEILLCQYDLSSISKDSRLSYEDKETKRDIIKAKFEDIADKVALNYDKAKVQLRLEQERQIAHIIRHERLQNEVVLVADKITKNYRSSQFTLKAEHLELRLGEITGLVGENATGKTTLLRILAGELRQDSGTVRFPLFDPKNRLDWTDLKLRIVYVPQELPAWKGSLIENLTFEAARHGITGNENKQDVEFIIQRLGLAFHTEKAWEDLSGGYKLRFSLAKALICRTQLLVLDEPLAFLDAKAQITVLSDLRNLTKSLKYPLSILISSQHLVEIESVADRMLFIKDGILENLGATKEFNKNRSYNLFELECGLSFPVFERRLEGFTYKRIWQNDLTFILLTPLSIDSIQLLKFLTENNISISYFRDISGSTKAKFYEEAL